MTDSAEGIFTPEQEAYVSNVPEIYYVPIYSTSVEQKII